MTQEAFVPRRSRVRMTEGDHNPDALCRRQSACSGGALAEPPMYHWDVVHGLRCSGKPAVLIQFNPLSHIYQSYFNRLHLCRREGLLDNRLHSEPTLPDLGGFLSLEVGTKAPDVTKP